jgi:hypothetical protein
MGGTSVDKNHGKAGHLCSTLCGAGMMDKLACNCNAADARRRSPAGEPVQESFAHWLGEPGCRFAGRMRKPTIDQCVEAGQHTLLLTTNVHHTHGCERCLFEMKDGEINSSNVINGWFHGPCLAQLVTPRQEMAAIDVELSGIGRLLDLPEEGDAL